MTPHRKFGQCLRLIECYFDFIHQNVFSDRWQLSLIYVVNLFMILAAIYGGCYTIGHYDRNTACNAAVILIGSVQIVDCQNCADVLSGFFDSLRMRITVRISDNWYFEGPILRILSAERWGCYGAGRHSVIYLCNIGFIYIYLILLATYDSMILLSFCNVPLLSAIIVREVDGVQTILNSKNVERIEIKRRLLKIIVMQKNYKDLIGQLNHGFGRLCAIQIGFTTAFTAVGVFVALTEHIAAAYAVVAIGCVQIILYCSYGLLVEISSTRIEEVVVRLDWHLLPKEERTLYMMFLTYAQKTQVLYIAKVWPLNMERSVTILNTIYSYAMLLRRMVV